MEKNDSFKIMKNTKELVSDVVEFSRNFPKSESVLKKNLQDELFNLVRLLNSYIVNRDSSRIREKHFAGGMGLEDGNGPTEAGMKGERGAWRTY